MEKLKCNNCEWKGYEEDLSMLETDINDESETPTAIENSLGNIERFNTTPENIDFVDVCPNCKVDDYLSEIK